MIGMCQAEAKLAPGRLAGALSRTRRGAVIVELAIIAPVLIAMMLGMIELGRAIMVRQTLTSAARKAARDARYAARKSKGKKK